MLDELIEQFRASVTEAALAKAKELDLRNRLFAKLQELELAKPVGAKTSTYGKYKIVATGKVNTTIYQAGIAEVRAKLGDKLFDAVFIPKLEFSATGFKQLNDDQKSIAEDALVKTPGTPTIAITLVEENAN